MHKFLGFAMLLSIVACSDSNGKVETLVEKVSPFPNAEAEDCLEFGKYCTTCMEMCSQLYCYYPKGDSVFTATGAGYTKFFDGREPEFKKFVNNNSAHIESQALYKEIAPILEKGEHSQFVGCEDCDEVCAYYLKLHAGDSTWTYRIDTRLELLEGKDRKLGELLKKHIVEINKALGVREL